MHRWIIILASIQKSTIVVMHILTLLDHYPYIYMYTKSDFCRHTHTYIVGSLSCIYTNNDFFRHTHTNIVGSLSLHLYKK